MNLKKSAVFSGVVLRKVRALCVVAYVITVFVLFSTYCGEIREHNRQIEVFEWWCESVGWYSQRSDRYTDRSWGKTRHFDSRCRWLGWGKLKFERKIRRYERNSCISGRDYHYFISDTQSRLLVDLKFLVGHLRWAEKTWYPLKISRKPLKLLFPRYSHQNQKSSIFTCIFLAISLVLRSLGC